MEHLDNEVPYHLDASTYMSNQCTLASNFHYAAPTNPPYPDYIQNFESPQAEAQCIEHQSSEARAQRTKAFTQWVNSQDTNDGDEILCRMVTLCEA